MLSKGLVSYKDTTFVGQNKILVRRHQRKVELYTLKIWTKRNISLLFKMHYATFASKTGHTTLVWKKASLPKSMLFRDLEDPPDTKQELLEVDFYSSLP